MLGRLIAFNLTVLGLLTVGYYKGITQLPFTEDTSRLTWGIAAMLGIGLVVQLFRRYEWSKYIERRLVTFGLVGTVVGFIMALGQIDPSKVSDLEYLKTMVGFLLDGMGTALYTTLVGALGAVWLSFNHRLIGVENGES